MDSDRNTRKPQDPGATPGATHDSRDLSDCPSAKHDTRETGTSGLSPAGAESAATVPPGGAQTTGGGAHIEHAGQAIGRYKLLQAIGEGGFGVVWMAEQEQPVRRRVALKIIKLGMDTRQDLARFEAERQALAMMDHPSIAKVFDAGATRTGRPYFVMELVKGVPITDYCNRHSLSFSERLKLFMQVCGAVQHAHQKGIIHRDIKPSNVLVTHIDDKPAPKVIDFGIAKATQARLTEQTMFTEIGQFIGTPAYMSPEQADPIGMDIDTRSDIYSLGVLLYELLTGATPFDSKSLRKAGFEEIKRIIREDEPSRPSTRLSRLGAELNTVAKQRAVEPRKLGTILRGDLDWIIMKALEKDRARRYETANGLAMDIERYLTGEAVVAAPPSATYRFRKLVRRRRGTVTASAAVAVSLLIGVVAFAWQARVAVGQRDRAVLAEAETRKKADELQQVSDFQASMLRQIDATAAGETLFADIRDRFGKALEKAEVPQEQRESRAALLARELGQVNATDAAAAMIDRTILWPSIMAIDQRFKDQPAVDATLRHTLADLYRILGRYDDAFPLQSSALATRRRVLGEDDSGTLDSINSLASILESQGEQAEAEALYREALDKRRRVSGDEDPETLNVMGNLGTLLRSQGKLDEAEPLLRTSLEGSRRVKGPEHRSTLIAMNMYGYLLIDQGKLSAAEPYWREAYETGKRVFGADDPDVFVWTNNMGGLLGAQGHDREAESFYREAFGSCRRIRGEEHPQTLSCQRNVGFALKQQGRYAEAEPLIREALDKRRRVLGDDHPDTLSSIGDLGGLLQAQARFDEAEPYYREQLERCQRILGKEHPNTLNALSNTGFFLKAQGKLAEAERCNSEALEIRRRILGEEHPDTLMSASNLCVLLMDADKLADAETLGRDVLEKRRRVLGEDHPGTLVSNNILSQVLVRQDRLSDAEPYCRAALESGRRGMGPDHPDTLIFTMNLGGILQDQGKLVEAEALLRDALERCTRVLGAAHSTTVHATTLLGSLLKEQGNLSEAVELLVPAEERARAAFTEGNAPRLARLLKTLGNARAGLAKDPADFVAAETNLLEAYAIYSRVRGEKHKDTRKCASALADFYAAWDHAQADKGHELKSAEWKAKLDAAGTSAQPAATSARAEP